MEIERLQRDVAYLQAKLSAGPDDSNTFADPYSDSPRPLGTATIEFVTTSGAKIRARLERDRVSGLYERLNINADNPIAIFPNASNDADVRVVGFAGRTQV